TGDAGSLRFGDVFGAGAATAGFGAGSVTTASVSCTGRSAVAAGAGAPAAGDDGWICADTGAGTAFCRDARYPPPAAAPIQATASAANASRFDNMTPLDLG